MGLRKIPDDAFEVYLSLGPSRSYAALAGRFGVNKRSVTAIAKREDWQGRIRVVETKAREASDMKATEALAAMRTKHLKMLEVVQAKALEALKRMPLATAYQAVRALATAIDQERVTRGEPEDQTKVDVEAIIKREYQMLFGKPGEKEEDDWSDLEHPDGEEVGDGQSGGGHNASP